MSIAAETINFLLSPGCTGRTWRTPCITDGNAAPTPRQQVGAGGAQSYDNVILFPQIRDHGPAMIKREGCTGNSPWDYSASDKVRIGQLIPCNERVDEPGGDT